MQQVLVIDDHLQIREMTSRLLASRYDVTVKPNALDIVSDFERLNEPVVVLDIWMPQMDGFTAAAVLKDEHPEARIIFLSSDHNPGAVAKAFALGGTAFVIKTRAAVELVPAIEAALEAPAS